MGNSSSSTCPSVLTDSLHISKESPKNIKSTVPKMAATMDAQILPLDDLSQDTLMGLQELDSHLAIFDCSVLSRDSSTPGAISESVFNDAVDSNEKASHMVNIKSLGRHYSRQVPYEASPRAKVVGVKLSSGHIIE